MKRKLFFFLISIFSLNLSATHIMGGEITWLCIKDSLIKDNNGNWGPNPKFGKYVFTLKVYRDCELGNAATIGTYPLDVWNHPTVSSIPWESIYKSDISPLCDPISSGNLALNCASGTLGAVEEWVFTSDAIALPGIPPAVGWHFTWESCCRNGAISNLVILDPSYPAEGFTLRAAMFPYTDASGNLVPADPCFDSSPIFKEEAKTILCTGYPFSYNNLGFDVELDSISYSWDEPLDDANPVGFFNPPINPAPIPWQGTYTVNSPLPGGITLDPITGQVSYNSNTGGNFVSVIRADAFKCGQKIASVYREIQVVLINCGNLPNGSPNSPPLMTSPFTDPITGLPSNDTIVMAGRPISFTICAEDTNTNISGNLQNLTLELVGGQTDPLFAIDTFAVFDVTNSVPGSICGVFTWVPNCFHMQDLGCGTGGNGLYTFNIKANDDFCPANGMVIATITINVVPPVPDLRCLAVDLSGDVDVSLTYPIGVADTNIKYDLYFSKQFGGPYSIVDSIFYPDTTFYHLGSDANTSKSYYYLVGTGTCGTNISSVGDNFLYSDTLSTILMEANTINMGLTADLSWNQIHEPLLSSSSIDYDLHYINSQTNDNVIANLPDLFYQMDGENCNYFPQFYVEIPDASGCVSKSAIGVTHLLDTIAPITPIITDVSVDVNGKSVISWLSSIEADYYIVYIEDANGAWITLDTVALGANSYEFVNSSAFQGVENFSVRAVDSCGNSRVRSLEHNSIFVVHGSDICAYSIFLDWNDYINWEKEVSHYKVFVLEIDENNISTSSELRVSLVTELLINNINSLSTYSVYIQAYNEDSTFIAMSNVLNISIAMPIRPLFNYLEYATVNHDNGLVEINCLVDNNAVIDHYDIYRTEEFDINGDGVNYSKIDEVNFTGNTNFIFNDDLTNTNTNSYRYKVYPVDTCGVSLTTPYVNNPSDLDTISYAQTILLSVEKNIDYSEISSLSDEYTNTLFFNEYKKWIGEVSKYELYRSVNNEPFNLLPLYTWYRNTNFDEELHYIDIVTNDGNGNGRFCYYIKASEGNITPYGPAALGSFSNIICVSQIPVIFIPNTFTPNSDDHNEIFKPFTYFVSEKGYLFSIYNKQGQKLFETNNPQKGWDGSFKNSLVQNDNYVYYLKYVNGDGEITENTGTITLVR